MFLFSPILLRHLKFSINFINIFHALPYKWNKTTGLIDYTDSNTDKSSFRNWKLVSHVTILHGVFFLIAYCDELYRFTSDDEFGDMVMSTIVFLTVFVTSFLQFFIIKRGKPLIICCNRFLKYYIEIQGKIRHSQVIILLIFSSSS